MSYGRESEKQVFSLMDGVPVKISEQFKPPRKVRLPAGYEQRLLAETTTEEYDFSLERSVLQKMGEWRRLRKVAEEKRKDRIKLKDLSRKTEKISPIKNTQAGTSNTHSNSGSDKSSQSKSVPDIVEELEKELRWKAMDRNRQSPNLRPSSYESTGLQNWKPSPNLDQSPDQRRSCIKKTSSATVSGAANPLPMSKLANPFNDLSPSTRTLAKHISEMGFDLARVARACKAVGPDDKKVVEYLLQVQALEEIYGDNAERALEASGFDKSKAIAHLEAMKQLLGLGFKEEEIFDALVRCDNDRDKALEYLIL